MPQGRGGSLATDIYVTSTAYVLQQNGFPAGEEPLEPGAPRRAAPEPGERHAPSCFRLICPLTERLTDITERAR